LNIRGLFVVRTVTTVAGQAPVDAECKTMLGKAHVYSENKDIFDCMLNQVRKFSSFFNIYNDFVLDECWK